MQVPEHKDTNIGQIKKTLFDFKETSPAKASPFIFKENEESQEFSSGGLDEERFSTHTSLGSEGISTPDHHAGHHKYFMVNELDSPVNKPRAGEIDQELCLPLSANREHPNISSVHPRVVGHLVKLSQHIQMQKQAAAEARKQMDCETPPKQKVFDLHLIAVHSSPDKTSSLTDCFENQPKLHREHSIGGTSAEDLFLNKNKHISAHNSEDFEPTQEETSWIKSNPPKYNLLHKKNQEVIIFDCRYEFEYRGGHIEGALNVNKPSLVEFLFKVHKEHMFDRRFLKGLKSLSGNPVTMQSLRSLVDSISNPREDSEPLVIFHCEFSSKRGPKLWTYLRNLDRQMNTENYPHLSFPQTYLLKSGYSSFVIEQGDLCIPRHKYVSMFEESYKQDFSTQKAEEQADWDEIETRAGCGGRKKRKGCQSRLDF